MKFLKSVPIILSLVVVLNLSACSNKLTEDVNSEPTDSNVSNNTTDNNAASGDYIATMAGENIIIPEFKFYLSAAKNEMESGSGINNQDKNAVKAFWDGKTGNESNAVTAKNKALDTLKEIKILVTKAKEEKIQLNNDDLTTLKTFVDQVIQTEGAGDRVKAGESLKSKYNVNLSEYEAIYKTYLLAYQKYATASLKKIDVSDKDLKDYYDKNISKYDKVTVKHILILTQDAATGQAIAADKLAEKQKLAEEILSKAKAGTDFESLVTQYSEDPGSKEKKGEYTFGKGEMVKEFEDWSYSAKVGDMGLVKTTYGFHVMKFVGKASLDSQKDTVKQDLQTELFKVKIEEWKKDEKYKVTINQKAFDSIKLY